MFVLLTNSTLTQKRFNSFTHILPIEPTLYLLQQLPIAQMATQRSCMQITQNNADCTGSTVRYNRTKRVLNQLTQNIIPKNKRGRPIFGLLYLVNKPTIATLLLLLLQLFQK